MASPRLKKTSVNPPHQIFGYNNDDDARTAVRATRFVSTRRQSRPSYRSASSPSRLDGLEDSKPFSSAHERRTASLANDTVSSSQSSLKQTWIHGKSSAMMHSGLRNDRFIPGFSPKLDKERSMKPKGNIRSHLKRSNHNDSASINLDRSTLENEGLGIYTNLERDRRYGDIATSRRAGATSHNRSTSGTSQFSATTASSTLKPGLQYVHPMRRTPRPYTPPISQSYQNSVVESEQSTDVGQFSADLDDAASSNRDVFAQPSEPQPYRIHPSSFTNISSSVLSNHARESYEAPSPLSRSSLDFTFRSRTRTNTDPSARAAAVEAARQAFEDKEAAKQRKLDKQNMKAQDRELRRQEKKEHQFSLSTATSSLGRRSHEKRNSSEGRCSGRKPMSEKRDNATGDYAFTHNNPSRTFESPKSAWVLFITWLRTKLFKMSRKLSMKKKKKKT
ncbi:hypothetical protein I7I53_04635 [Histoplasma capsulatum var. duboisii H88]|uniref:Uncharacterized protein n=2 Tax=Ajellomyces capsulatus TaxID=5037 RepID=A0A8A1LSZ8_AJEC8|nr:conserved hypothetical protein [Histoplasma capsulatum H143]QSS56430.1 hypothetical protein I7I53_04635 [Histoplasma capsulatum var. duboisii H88]